jgi:hypothetical protein
LFDLQTICAKYGLETWFTPNHDIRIYLLDVKHSWTNARFQTWITRNDVNGESFFHLSYLMTLMVYLCSQRTPNVQIKFFMFDCSIYSLLVLNTGCKPDSFQMMIFVNVCSTWGMVELKTRFETWITRNDVNGYVCFTFLFNNPYGLPVLTMNNKCPNQVFYVWLVDLQTICAK